MTDHHEAGAPHSTFKGYLTGFVLAVILTAIPFWLVMGKVIPSANTTSLVILKILLRCSWVVAVPKVATA